LSVEDRHLPWRKGQKARLHDLRRAFAVHCLKQWEVQGIDLKSALLLLSAYMGHTGFKRTQQYLRLTADLFPDIVAAIERGFGDEAGKEANDETH